MFCGEGEFWKSRQAVNKALRRLQSQGIAEAIGAVSFKGEGGNCVVWIAKDVCFRRNQVKHDVVVSMVRRVLKFRHLRAPETDAKREQDLILFDEFDVATDWEIDTSSMTYRELVETRYAKYLGTDRPVVWVSCGLWNTSDTTRLEGMRVRAEPIKDVAWFVTLGDLLKDRRNATLVNYDEEETTVSDVFPVPAPKEAKA